MSLEVQKSLYIKKRLSQRSSIWSLYCTFWALVFKRDEQKSTFHVFVLGPHGYFIKLIARSILANFFTLGSDSRFDLFGSALFSERTNMFPDMRHFIVRLMNECVFVPLDSGAYNFLDVSGGLRKKISSLDPVHVGGRVLFLVTRQVKRHFINVFLKLGKELGTVRFMVFSLHIIGNGMHI